MITVTARAAAKFQEIAKAENYEGFSVRAKVVGGGCAGFSYDLYFDDLPATELDEEFEMLGVKIRVDPMSLQYLDGTEIDYVTNDRGEGFKFLNPNVTGTCGCGSSFSA